MRCSETFYICDQLVLVDFVFFSRLFLYGSTATLTDMLAGLEHSKLAKQVVVSFKLKLAWSLFRTCSWISFYLKQSFHISLNIHLKIVRYCFILSIVLSENFFDALFRHFLFIFKIQTNKKQKRGKKHSGE